jgi:methylphosphotriester-DNA--protein-cysteine methyltransferase
MFYASKKYKIVCKEDCFHVNNIKEKNLIVYESLNDALKDGCRPCKHCFKTLEPIDNKTIREYKKELARAMSKPN